MLAPSSDTGGSTLPSVVCAAGDAVWLSELVTLIVNVSASSKPPWTFRSVMISFGSEVTAAIMPLKNGTRGCASDRIFSVSFVAVLFMGEDASSTVQFMVPLIITLTEPSGCTVVFFSITCFASVPGSSNFVAVVVVGWRVIFTAGEVAFAIVWAALCLNVTGGGSLVFLLTLLVAAVWFLFADVVGVFLSVVVSGVALVVLDSCLLDLAA